MDESRKSDQIEALRPRQKEVIRNTLEKRPKKNYLIRVCYSEYFRTEYSPF